MAEACKFLHLGCYNGDPAQAKSFLQRFDLLSAKSQWDDDDKKLQLAFHLSDSAANWLSSLPIESTDTYAHLRTAFEAYYLNCEPLLVTESRLLARRLQAGESLTDYYANILSLGAKLGRKPDQLATQFVNGLPEAFKEYILSTDTHTLDNYLSRAKMYHARHPTRTVQFQGATQFMVPEAHLIPDESEKFVMMTRELVNAVENGLAKLKIDTSKETKSHSPGRNSSPQRDYNPRGRNFSPRG